MKDLVSLFRILAGPDGADLFSFSVPPTVSSPELTRDTSLKGWKLGVSEDWLRFTKVESIVDNYRASIVAFEERGATIVPFRVPAFDQIRLAHTGSILTEMAATMKYYERYRSQMMAMVDSSLNLGMTFDAVFYVQAQKIRTFAIAFFSDLFRDMHCIVTPTTANVAPQFYKPGSDMTEGISDAEALFDAMSFVFISNFIGNPAVAVVNGYDRQSGLPTSLQVMSRFFCEEDAMWLAAIVEQNVAKTRPNIYHDVLQKK